jgi:hypothetical protein
MFYITIVLLLFVGHFASATPVENKATVQIIHNSPDTSLHTIDLYLNNNLLISNLHFREATKYFSTISNTSLKLQIARSPSTSAAESFRTLYCTVEKDKNAAILMQGVDDTLSYSPNPNGKSIELSLLVLENINLQPIANNESSIRIANGCTDVANSNLVAKDVAPLLADMTFGTSSPKEILMPAIFYDFLLLEPNTQEIIRSFPANLTDLGGQSVVLFFSGFHNPKQNCNGKQLGLFGAKKDGTIIDFQSSTSITSSEIFSSKYMFHQTTRQFTIASEFPQNESITIYNYSGQEVYSSLLDHQQVEISLGNFSHGIYFVSIKKNDSTVVMHVFFHK